MPESEIENCIDGYEGEFASVFESAGRSVERARAELAELRAKAERADRASDCELVVRWICAGRLPLSAAGRRELCVIEDHGERIAVAIEWAWGANRERFELGIVAGLPMLTEKARAAIVQALERREG